MDLYQKNWVGGFIIGFASGLLVMFVVDGVYFLTIISALTK